MFAHFSAIQMDGFRTLKQGSRVAFELTKGPKGDLAQNIRAVDATWVPVLVVAGESSVSQEKQ